jgi:2-polyprenyl-3-methyl-5-hydroxy-6-metoxy-1,4-benzoquinol methylase
VDGTYGDRLKENFERILTLPERKSDNTARVKRVLDFAKGKWGDKKVPNLLDVGAGLAVFPYRMKEAGWQVTALDPDERAAAHARENAGVKSVHADFLQWEPETGENFDVISFNKVLEHIENPLRLLQKAVKILRKDGFIYIEVPDAKAASEGSEREEFFVEHFHVFSQASLECLAERANMISLSSESINEPSGKFTLYGIYSANA